MNTKFKSLKKKVQDRLPDAAEILVYTLGAAALAYGTYKLGKLVMINDLCSQWDKKIAEAVEGDMIFLDRDFKWMTFTPDKK